MGQKTSRYGEHLGFESWLDQPTIHFQAKRCCFSDSDYAVLQQVIQSRMINPFKDGRGPARTDWTETAFQRILSDFHEYHRINLMAYLNTLYDRIIDRVLQRLEAIKSTVRLLRCHDDESVSLAWRLLGFGEPPPFNAPADPNGFDAYCQQWKNRVMSEYYNAAEQTFLSTLEQELEKAGAEVKALASNTPPELAENTFKLYLDFDDLFNKVLQALLTVAIGATGMAILFSPLGKALQLLLMPLMCPTGTCTQPELESFQGKTPEQIIAQVDPGNKIPEAIRLAVEQNMDLNTALAQVGYYA